MRGGRFQDGNKPVLQQITIGNLLVCGHGPVYLRTRQADAIPFRPHTVAWYLAGEERGSDERMVELLEPYRGHRFRVVSLLWQSGITAPRRGPRMASNRWRFSSRR